MTKISSQETAILGLLHEHHHYAPRIQEIMAKRGMDKWTDMEFSSIDSILKELEKKKLVESRIQEGTGKSSGEVYYITEKGRSIFKKEIKSLLSQKGKITYPFDLGLANINVLDHDEIIQSLELYLNSIEERIQSLEYSIKIQEENNIPYNFIAIYSRSVLILKAEKMWVKEFMENYTAV